MPSTFRQRDSIVEKEIAKFMDEKFYGRQVTGFIRFEDKENQLKGKDVSFTWGELKNIIVDEKAQTHYINENLPTFAFEISFIRAAGEWTLGWLFDKTKENDYFILIWPFASKKWDITKEDIEKLDCLLINKQKIIDLLEKEGFSRDKIMTEEERIRKENNPGKIGSGNFYFYFTGRLAEKPINLVIRKEKLIEIAEKRFIIPPNQSEKRDLSQFFL
jgi:hypothetical protein